MSIRVLPDDLINQIAAGEVVERPASVVKELIENALDAGADQIVVDVADGGRTLISVVDNGAGMSRADLEKSILRHATSKLAGDDLLNICFMGFRGEALPSIASVSDMKIDTRDSKLETRGSSVESRVSGLELNCTTGEIKPSAWESGTRVRVENLFGKTPARLKFLRTDRAEMMSIVEIVKRLALSRPDVGFILNNKWRFPKGQSLEARIVAVMGDDVDGRMIEIRESGVGSRESTKTVSDFNSADYINDSRLPTPDSRLALHGFISEPTLRRASSVDQYLFVNGRPVKDKGLIGALRAAYMDVMSAREFPLCALYLNVPSREVDVNVSPAKTEVHFLEPARVRSLMIRTIRDALAKTVAQSSNLVCHPAKFCASRIYAGSSGFDGSRNGSDSEDFLVAHLHEVPDNFSRNAKNFRDDSLICVREPERPRGFGFWDNLSNREIDNVGAGLARPTNVVDSRGGLTPPLQDSPLGRVIGQIGNKYIVAENAAGLVIVDQHAAHERIVYEKLRSREIKRQPLLSPIVIKLKPEEVVAIMEVSDELDACGLKVSEFGDDAVAVYERPADWNLDWSVVLKSMADEVRASGHSSNLSERLHLKLANYACHHSVRAGQRLDPAQMDALLRDIENTERAGQCNHGRPVYRIISLNELDGWFERM